MISNGFYLLIEKKSSLSRKIFSFPFSSSLSHLLSRCIYAYYVSESQLTSSLISRFVFIRRSYAVSEVNQISYKFVERKKKCVNWFFDSSEYFL